MRNILIGYVIVLMTLTLTGCASPVRQHAVPDADQSRAQIPRLKNVRYTIGEPQDMKAFQLEAMGAARREFKYRGLSEAQKDLPPVNFLAVSGGGDNGAFTAGLLNGWSDSGTRPEFKLVTGVSTGGLIAPFAFLGQEYDNNLKDFYTNTSAEDIMKPRWLVSALFSDAIADNTPLWRLVGKEVTREMLDKIAAEYEKGRVLLVGTTNLDSRRPVIWNMTRIAQSKDTGALKLFHSIMIASAAIPGAFPPVMIDVEVDGEKYQEMHVDGGTSSQVFVYPPSLHVKEIAKKHGVQRERNLYVIRNDKADPSWSDTERHIIDIAGRSISSLIHTQGMGDLYRIFLTAKRDGIAYNLAFIPPDFNVEHKEEFDTAYMRALYQHAYDLALKGYKWHQSPPGFE